MLSVREGGKGIPQSPELALLEVEISRVGSVIKMQHVCIGSKRPI